MKHLTGSATRKGEETRERILDAALRLFAQRGFDETTMRDVAAEAGAATGASYYYFRSKNELVMAFYIRTANEMNERVPAILASTKDLRKRIEMILDAKLDQFREHRRLLATLFRTAADPDDPLSPFGDETASIRGDAIAVFGKAIEGTKTTIPSDLVPHLPRLLWFYQMAMLLFWIFDRSEDQRKTRILMSGTLDLLMKLLQLASLPLLGGTRKKAVGLLKALDAA